MRKIVNAGSAGRCVVVAAVSVVTLALAQPASASTAERPVSVLHVGQVAAQNVPVLPGSEPDTLVEPDLAVSPLHPNVALTVAHDGRYADGGAVGIAYAWTDNGGARWHSSALPKLTVGTGGPAVWERASDPVAAYGPDGTAYVSTLLFNSGCDSAVAVSRSTDGGKTFGAPVLAHRSSTCAVSDDKNWLVVDDSATSPHKGRLYQFWTPFLTDIFGNSDGSPQALVYSDDSGRTWSQPVNVSPPHANSQNSQPMLRPNGHLVDAYLDYGPAAAAEGPEAAGARRTAHRATPTPSPSAAAPSVAAASYPVFVTRLSSDGGATWHQGGTVTSDVGEGPAGFRCCLPSAVSDPVSGRLYAAWNSRKPAQVRLSSSTDGVHWSAPVLVNHGTGGGATVNADVSAYNGSVAVSFGVLDAKTGPGTFGQQYVATSHNRGATFTNQIAIGPVSNYAYAAQARGIFPGDYIGSAMTKGRLYLAWCRSSRPPSGGKYHQVRYAAVFGI